MDQAERWLKKLRQDLMDDRRSPSTIRCRLITARSFLQFAGDRGISVREVRPNDVSAFLAKKHQEFSRRHGHPPENEIRWRCGKTPAIHRLLTLVQNRWPPVSDIDQRLDWFRNKLGEERIGPRALQKQSAMARHFLEFLRDISVVPEEVTPGEIAAFLRTRLQIYRRTIGRSPADMDQWRQYLTGPVNRFLRYMHGQWPPPSPPDADVETFKQHLAGRGVIRSTIAGYCVHVRIFLEFLRARRTSVDSVQRKDVDAFDRVALRMYRKQKPNWPKNMQHWSRFRRRCIYGFLRFRLGEWPPDPTRLLVARFKAHLEERHYDIRVIGRYLWVARIFLRYLEARGLSLDQSQPADITDFLQIQFKRYRKRHGHPPLYEAKWQVIYTAPVHLLLRTMDPEWPRAKPPASPADRFQQKVYDAYARWLTDVRGLSEGTLRKNGWAAREFLRWLAEHAAVADRRSLRRLSIEDLDRYLAWRLPSLRRATRVGVSGCLRSFLRYLYTARLIAHDLAAAVSTPSLYQYEDIPRAFTQQQVEGVLAVTRRDRSAKGLRDYAILLMLATYGMRAGEVIRLRLEDIDWRQERIGVLQSKTHRESVQPLVAPVAEAILQYLRERPRTDDREVFLRLRAPWGRLCTTSSLAAVIRRRLQEAGIVVNGRHGSHAFRFARAVSLLRASVPVKWISDVLGHVAASSTQTYLRLATDDLRALSLEVPGRTP